jgi:hypothetical protein
LWVGEEAAGELRIARCTPLHPSRSTAPAHMVERGRIWRRSDVRAAPHALLQWRAACLASKELAHPFFSSLFHLEHLHKD